MPHLTWTDESRLSAGMTLREDGDMRLRADDGVQDDVLRKRCAFLETQFSNATIAAPLPVHGAAVATVTGNEPFHEKHALFSQTDALVTVVPGIALTVTAADCLPVYFFDPVRGTIGLAHAGWRGLVAPPHGVLAATVEALVVLGSKPMDIRVEVGPSIGPCHYVVDAARRKLFAARFGNDVVCREALDLRRAAVRALVDLGLDAKQISAEPPCTVCQSDRFFSHRVDGREPPGVGMAWIVLHRPG
ncbi:MAG: polyphenol oxidase family protein [Patescibacteria group bacterium]